MCCSIRLTLAHFSNSLIEHSGHSPRCPNLLTKLQSHGPFISSGNPPCPFLPQGLCTDYSHCLKCHPSMFTWSFLSFYFSHSTFHSPKLLYLLSVACVLPVCPSLGAKLHENRDPVYWVAGLQNIYCT